MRLRRIAVLWAMRLDRIGAPAAHPRSTCMRIFITGASGWIGSALVPELIGTGHQVLGLARSDASAKAVTDLGAEGLRGDLHAPAVLRAGARDSAGVVHLAFEHAVGQVAGAQSDA